MQAKTFEVTYMYYGQSAKHVILISANDTAQISPKLHNMFPYPNRVILVSYKAL